MSSPQTVSELFLDRIAKTPNAEAFQFPAGGGWKSITWKETGEKVRQIACGLRALGVSAEQRVSILSGTRVEWILADLGILCAAGATTTIYPSSTADESVYIIKDSNSVFVFAENDEQVAKLSSKRGELGDVKKVITIDGKSSADGWVMSLQDLYDLGKKKDAEDPAAFEKVAHGPTKDSLATLIYTSGTTGKPKGVELTHDCWMFEGEGIDSLGIITPSDRQYFWLPLAHSFGKVLEAAQLRIGFPTAIDGRVEKLVENLAVIQPTFVCGVPRIFEKVYNKVAASGTEGSPVKRKIFNWAIGVGREVSALQQAGKPVPALLNAKRALAHKLVFSKVHARFGGKLRFFISGSAALSKEVSSFFHAVGLLILEGYGLTETSAGTFVNRSSAYKFGTVGQAIGTMQAKLAEDGEILLKGRGVMRGYHNMPEATAEVFTPDGWFKTGDIGELDAQGFLKITDRKKDLIKTSGGKYVAPQFLEGKLKAACPYFSQVVIHGDNRKFISALVTLDEEAIRKYATENGVSGKTYTEIVSNPKVKQLIQGYFDKLNKELPSYETIKYFAILPTDLTIDSGELTPSMKLKRKFVEKKYIHVLDEFYKDSAAA
ncbi:MAG: long-chain fatty acid--CoA ligase [Myxococcota bacterium]|nr:long-chain fatty acid--CoA ligase [Myxococcota bacterium]